MNTNEPHDLYWDRSEFQKAASAPEYRDSARFRDEVAAKLQRSIAAGRITPMGEQITHEQRTHTRNASSTNEGLYGEVVAMPGPHPHWAEAGKIGTGFFKGPDEIANAFSAPAFAIDPTYQQAVREKIERSIREGYLTADLKAADPAQRGR